MHLIRNVHVAGAEEEILEALVEAIAVAVQLERAQEPPSFSTGRRRRRLGLLLHLHLDPRRGDSANAEALFARRVARRDRSRQRWRRRWRRVPAGRRRRGAFRGWLPGEPLDELAEVPGLRLDDLRRQDVDDPDIPPRRRLRDGVGEPVRGRRRRRRCAAGWELRGVLHGVAAGEWFVCVREREAEGGGGSTRLPVPATARRQWREGAESTGGLYRRSGLGPRAVWCPEN